MDENRFHVYTYYDVDSSGIVRRARVLIQSDEDIWDNFSVVIENQSRPETPGNVERLQRAVPLSCYDQLPPDFFPCNPINCSYHRCECMRQYEGRDFNS